MVKSESSCCIGYLPSGTLKGPSLANQIFASCFLVLLDYTTLEHLKPGASKDRSYPVPSTSQFCVRLHWCHEHLHVHFWSHQIIFLTPDGSRKADLFHPWSSSHHPLQHSCGKRCCNMGPFRQQISFLRRQQRAERPINHCISRSATLQCKLILKLYVSNKA